MPYASWGIGISEGSEHKEEAWKLVEYLMSPEVNSKLVTIANAFPGNVKAKPDLSKSDPLFSEAFKIYQEGYLANEFVGLPVAEELMRQMDIEVQKLLEGQTTAQQAGRRHANAVGSRVREIALPGAGGVTRAAGRRERVPTTDSNEGAWNGARGPGRDRHQARQPPAETDLVPGGHAADAAILRHAGNAALLPVDAVPDGHDHPLLLDGWRHREEDRPGSPGCRTIGRCSRIRSFGRRPATRCTSP